MSNASLKIHLTDFDGPLELLLHLIKEAEMDIYDINIKEITDQYFRYLQEMKETQLEVAGEFFVMAANLMHIKSQWLLAEEIDDDQEEEDPRADLVEQLLEYKRYQQAAQSLQKRERQQQKLHSIAPLRREQDIEIATHEFEVILLQNAWQRIIRRNRQTTIGPLNQIEEWRFNLSDQATFIIDRVQQNSNQPLFFSHLFRPQAEPEEIVTDFLAVLTLTKQRVVRIRQSRGKPDFIIEGGENSNDN
ncbi:segregation and condensation protein A [Fructilactobacillus carniphilus]|uniref:Segregation and condensation protein A n=1 Tax=Fructilactobacillus carniphilus TaxID=2940297 RepID=A0ABY5BZ35_9LACO|nr:segregation/condensation protein A [Fructilactobacillus carniphilus]USS91049.1 segregation/condensation protein A [Fructilactobacillus carniphilus]